MAVKRKRLGIGSLAFVLMALGVLIAFTFKGRCIGDAVLDAVGLRAWSEGSRGVHYTVFYSLIFFVPSVAIASVHREHLFAKSGGSRFIRIERANTAVHFWHRYLGLPCQIFLFPNTYV